MLMNADQQPEALREANPREPMSRRMWIVGGAALAATALFTGMHAPLAIANAATLRGQNMPATVRIVAFGADGKRLGIGDVPP